jgi:hypothetical protein
MRLPHEYFGMHTSPKRTAAKATFRVLAKDDDADAASARFRGGLPAAEVADAAPATALRA